MSIVEKIAKLGLDIPVLGKSTAVFRPYSINGEVLTVSGQLPFVNGKISAVGNVPDQVSIDDARAAARHCIVNVLASVRDATQGDWERVTAVSRLGGFVVTAPGFFDAPSVINAASELIVELFGDKGQHARIAIGVASLPFNAAVEVEATFILKAG